MLTGSTKDWKIGHQWKSHINRTKIQEIESKWLLILEINSFFFNIVAMVYLLMTKFRFGLEYLFILSKAGRDSS